MHGTVAAAILIAATMTIVFGYIAVRSLLGVIFPGLIDPDFARGALFGSRGNITDVSGAAKNASVMVGLVFGVVVVVSVIIIIGLILRQSWAREAGMVVYGFLGLLALATSLSGITADPPAPSAWLGMLTGLANVSIVVLLLMRSSARDFDPILQLRRSRLMDDSKV